MRRRDPHLPERLRNEAMMRRGENIIHATVVTAMTLWLDATRHAIIPNYNPDTLLAAAGEQPDLDNAQQAFAVWARALTEHVEPALAEAFGEAFRANARVADISPVHYQEHHMATVHDRLVIWPEGAFEELRPELLEALAEGESMEQIEARIGRVLNIDAPARHIRADINELDKQLADPTTPRGELPGLRARRRQLWEQHDERNEEWQWKARRIARTEIQGAMNAGTLTAAQASGEITGDRMFKAWLATSDERTRHTHAVADGQLVRLTEAFTVGASSLQFPADPFGPGHEVINCRCSMRILTETETQSELQGQNGGRGVGPGNARLGPDAPDDVDFAIDKLKREQAGEVVEDTRPPTVAQRINRTPPETPAYDPVPVQETMPTPEPDAPDTVDAEPPADVPPEPPDDDADVPTDEPDDEEALNALLDEHFAPALEAYTPDQRDAINRWQGMDRFYQRVQGVSRGTIENDDEAAEVYDALLDALDAAEVPEPITVWRGVRDSIPAFGIANADLPQLVGRRIPIEGLSPTSTSQAVATDFTEPSLRGGHVLMQMRVPAGIPAVWVSAAGDPDLAGQFELLLAAGLTMQVTDVEYTGTVPIVVVEVIASVDDTE